MSPEETQKAISKKCEEIKELLLQKNRDYGNSALDPVRVFSEASPFEQLLVRVDDKLSRIKRGAGTKAGEDTILDLVGYLVLILIAAEEVGFQETEPQADTESVDPADLIKDPGYLRLAGFPPPPPELERQTKIVLRLLLRELDGTPDAQPAYQQPLLSAAVMGIRDLQGESKHAKHMWEQTQKELNAEKEKLRESLFQVQALVNRVRRGADPLALDQWFQMASVDRLPAGEELRATLDKLAQADHLLEVREKRIEVLEAQLKTTEQISHGRLLGIEKLEGELKDLRELR